MKAKLFITNLAMLFCVGCGSISITSIDQGTEPSIRLNEAQTRTCHYFSMTVKFPAGVYQPGYKTKQGTYYLSPTKVFWGGLPEDGGIFIPFATQTNKEQGVWLNALSATRVFSFSQPLSLELVQPQKSTP